MTRVVDASVVVAALAGELSPEAATLAQAEVHTLPIDLFPWWTLASRAWELR